jgi:SAM-dependent methyltransferase
MKDLVQLRRLSKELVAHYNQYAEQASILRKSCLELAEAFDQAGGTNDTVQNFTNQIIRGSQQEVSTVFDNQNLIFSVIEDHIRTREKEYLDQSYNVWKYKHNRTWFLNNAKNHPNLKVFDEDGLKFVQERLNVFESYKLQALDIGSGAGDWYEYLAAFNPVYMCDINWAWFDKIRPKYHDLFWYKNRIRFVKGTGHNLPEVPLESIGFVFSWNTFNFLPVEIISKYLACIKDVMLPGAHAMISYTNAEREDVHSFIENEIWAYNTETIMVDLIKSHGFRPMALFESDLRGSWIEFKKPGQHPDISIEYSNIGTKYCKKVF